MRLALLVLTAVLCAACAPQTFEQLHVPLTASRGFGHSEQRLDERRFVVTYNAPVQTGFSFAGEFGRQEADRQIARAFDLALVRAAEIALTNGFPAFRVEDRRNDVTSQNYEAWGRRQRNYAFDDASLAAQVTLVVALVPTLEPGAFDAQATQAEIRRRYAR